MENWEIKHYDMGVDGFGSTLFAMVGVNPAEGIIGSCMLFHDGLLQDFHIDEKFRGVGLGSDLFEFVEKIARIKNIRVLRGLVSSKNTALRFWNKKGFLVIAGNLGTRSLNFDSAYRIIKEIQHEKNHDR